MFICFIYRIFDRKDKRKINIDKFNSFTFSRGARASRLRVKVLCQFWIKIPLIENAWQNTKSSEL